MKDTTEKNQKLLTHAHVFDTKQNLRKLIRHGIRPSDARQFVGKTYEVLGTSGGGAVLVKENNDYILMLPPDTFELVPAPLDAAALAAEFCLYILKQHIKEMLQNLMGKEEAVSKPSQQALSTWHSPRKRRATGKQIELLAAK